MGGCRRRRPRPPRRGLRRCAPAPTSRPASRERATSCRRHYSAPDLTLPRRRPPLLDDARVPRAVTGPPHGHALLKELIAVCGSSSHWRVVSPVV
eukprot:1551317-Prymnesium_polylepis.1